MAKNIVSAKIQQEKPSTKEQKGIKHFGQNNNRNSHSLTPKGRGTAIVNHITKLLLQRLLIPLKGFRTPSSISILWHQPKAVQLRHVNQFAASRRVSWHQTSVRPESDRFTPARPVAYGQFHLPKNPLLIGGCVSLPIGGHLHTGPRHIAGPPSVIRFPHRLTAILQGRTVFP